MFKEIELFKDTATNLSLFLNSKKTFENSIFAYFFILNNKNKSGYLELQHNTEEKTLFILNFFLDGDFRNKGFATRLYEYGLPIVLNEVDFVKAKAFYGAETILKNNNWQKVNTKDNLVNYSYKI